MEQFWLEDTLVQTGYATGGKGGGARRGGKGAASEAEMARVLAEYQAVTRLDEVDCRLVLTPTPILTPTPTPTLTLTSLTLTLLTLMGRRCTNKACSHGSSRGPPRAQS